MTAAEAAAMLKRLGAGGFRVAVHRTMVEVALRGEGYAKGNAATVLNVRTGHLRRSIAGTVRDTPEGPEAVISAGGRVNGGASVRYAGVHEYGTKDPIRPKRGRYLRIPLPPARTAAGVDRFGGPLRQSGAGLFTVFKAKSGALYLRHKPSGQLWYKLVEQVSIRARPFLRPAADRAAADLPRVLARNITAELKRV
jgi:hypothetical protein